MPNFADLHLSALANLHLVYTNVACSIDNLQLHVNDLQRKLQAQLPAPQADPSSNSSATTIVDCSPPRVESSEATTICIDCNHRASSHAKNCANPYIPQSYCRNVPACESKIECLQGSPRGHDIEGGNPENTPPSGFFEQF